MAARFGAIRFNLMRAIEIFQDMNDADMDVRAPPSCREYSKEYELAERLNIYLGQLIQDGFFEDCDPREIDTDESDGSQEDEEEGEDEYDYDEEDDDLSVPESEGFNNSDEEPEEKRGSEQARSGEPDERASRESLTGRIRRYVKRILPNVVGGSKRRSSRSQAATVEQVADGGRSSHSYEHDENDTDYDDGSDGSYRSEDEPSYSSRALRQSRGAATRSVSSTSRRSLSGGRLTRERSGSEPYDPSIVYEHDHRHKHNHPNSHHHHEHRQPHSHAHHSHANEAVDVNDGGAQGRADESEEEEEGEDEDYDDEQDDREAERNV